MQAVMKLTSGVGNLEVCEIPDPVPGRGEVKLKVHAAGICGTDLQIYNDEFQSELPLVLGHQVAGEVVEVGQGVSENLLGHRVTSETFSDTPNISRHRHNGQSSLCRKRLSTDSSINGGFAEYVIVPAQNVHRLPERISYREGAITEPLACVVHGILFAEPTVRPGDLAVIAGPSTIGLLTLQVLKASHVTVVVLGTGMDSDRLALAKNLGADYVINVETRDILALIQDVSSRGLGADVVYECSGTDTAPLQLLDLVRHGGRYVQMELSGKSIAWNLDQICYKELTVTGSSTSTSESWIRAVHLLSTRTIKITTLLTHDFALSQWKDAFNVFMNQEGVKVLFRPHFDQS